MFSIFFPQDYVEWDEYKAKIGFLDEFYWQQNTRKQTIKNMPGVAEMEK